MKQTEGVDSFSIEFLNVLKLSEVIDYQKHVSKLPRKGDELKIRNREYEVARVANLQEGALFTHRILLREIKLPFTGHKQK